MFMMDIVHSCTSLTPLGFTLSFHFTELRKPEVVARFVQFCSFEKKDYFPILWYLWAI